MAGFSLACSKRGGPQATASGCSWAIEAAGGPRCWARSSRDIGSGAWGGARSPRPAGTGDNIPKRSALVGKVSYGLQSLPRGRATRHTVGQSPPHTHTHKSQLPQHNRGRRAPCTPPHTTEQRETRGRLASKGARHTKPQTQTAIDRTRTRTKTHNRSLIAHLGRTLPGTCKQRTLRRLQQNQEVKATPTHPTLPSDTPPFPHFSSWEQRRGCQTNHRSGTPWEQADQPRHRIRRIKPNWSRCRRRRRDHAQTFNFTRTVRTLYPHHRRPPMMSALRWRGAPGGQQAQQGPRAAPAAVRWASLAPRRGPPELGDCAVAGAAKQGGRFVLDVGDAQLPGMAAQQLGPPLMAAMQGRCPAGTRARPRPHPRRGTHQEPGAPSAAHWC